MKNYLTFVLMLTATIGFGCRNQGKSTNDLDMEQTAATADSGWITLFDGKSLAGWHRFNKTGEVTNWTILDSALVCGAVKGATGDDLVSNRQFDNFVLEWEWKVDKGSNSGVMYHVVEDPKYRAPSETGPEYQIIDDIGYPGKLKEWQKAGADYAMNLPNQKKQLKPVGEWNTGRIVFDNGHVEHWLNGEKIVEFEAWTPAWNKKKAEGKWKDYPDYGIAKKGYIVLQDHGKKTYFKNIRIREL